MSSLNPVLLPPALVTRYIDTELEEVTKLLDAASAAHAVGEAEAAVGMLECAHETLLHLGKLADLQMAYHGPPKEPGPGDTIVSMSKADELLQSFALMLTAYHFDPRWASHKTTLFTTVANETYERASGATASGLSVASPAAASGSGGRTSSTSSSIKRASSAGSRGRKTSPGAATGAARRGGAVIDFDGDDGEAGMPPLAPAAAAAAALDDNDSMPPLMPAAAASGSKSGSGRVGAGTGRKPARRASGGGGGARSSGGTAHALPDSDAPVFGGSSGTARALYLSEEMDGASDPISYAALLHHHHHVPTLPSVSGSDVASSSSSSSSVDAAVAALSQFMLPSFAQAPSAQAGVGSSGGGTVVDSSPAGLSDAYYAASNPYASQYAAAAAAQAGSGGGGGGGAYGDPYAALGDSGGSSSNSSAAAPGSAAAAAASLYGYPADSAHMFVDVSVPNVLDGMTALHGGLSAAGARTADRASSAAASASFAAHGAGTATGGDTEQAPEAGQEGDDDEEEGEEEDADASSVGASGGGGRRHKWTDKESALFEEGIKLYGTRKPRLIAALVGTRSNEQVRNHIKLYKRKGLLAALLPA